MLKYILIFICFPVFLQAQNVQNIGQLLDSLKANPQTKSDVIAVQKAVNARNSVYSKLFPDISGFGRYDYGSSPTGMLPVPPDEMFAMKADPSVGQPFSKNIFRVGAVISMPVYIQSLYTTARMAKMMVRSAKDKAYINLLSNEALLVGLNSNLIYVKSLKKALESKRASLLKTKQFVEIKVNNGRASGDALLKINNALNDISVTLNNLEIQKQQIIAVINSYTGVTLSKPVEMTQAGTFQKGEFKALNPLLDKLKATRLAYRAEKEKLLPSLIAEGSFSDNFARAYNNNLNINNHYTAAAIVLRIPIFSKDQYSQIKKSHLEMEDTRNEVAKLKLNLTSQSLQLQKSLDLLDNSLLLYKKSVKDKQQLLEIATVDYKTGRMTMEDYLKYVDDLVFEKASLYKARAEKWQTLMKLAVIYGNNIEQIVK